MWDFILYIFWTTVRSPAHDHELRINSHVLVKSWTCNNYFPRFSLITTTVELNLNKGMN